MSSCGFAKERRLQKSQSVHHLQRGHLHSMNLGDSLNSVERCARAADSAGRLCPPASASRSQSQRRHSSVCVADVQVTTGGSGDCPHVERSTDLQSIGVLLPNSTAFSA